MKVPIPMDEAVREVENRLLGVETNITNWQRRQNANNNFSAVIPYDMEQQRRESKEFLDDLTARDQRMMQGVLTMVLTADTKEQLDADTDQILSLSRQKMCQMAVLKYQQTDGLNTVLPIGTRKINAFRTLTTESLAVFMPFKVQEIQDKGGIYFGENAISHNLILCNRENLLNQSSFILGVPGSGKSFSAKELIAFLILNTQDDVLICDPEGEFAPMVQAMGSDIGTVVHVAAGGRDRLNAMYMVEGYGENNPIVEKSQFIMSLVEQIDKNGVGPQHKSIIDRCTALVYQEAAETGISEPVHQNTGKPVISTTLAIRLVLDRAATTEEAVELLRSYDMFASSGRDYHFYITDASGDGRVIEYDINGEPRELIDTPSEAVTNFFIRHKDEVLPNQKNDIYGHGRERYDAVLEVLETEKGNYTDDTVWNAMKSAAQDPNPDNITSNTQWSISYNNTDLSADIAIRRHWSDVTHCELETKVTTPLK